MKQLRIHLWREWREHRHAVYLLAVCLLLVAGLLAYVAPGGYLSLERVVPVIVLTAVLSIGSDLFTSEKQQGTDAFLARTPGALAGAFRAKLAFFLLLFAGSTVYGLGLGHAIAAMTKSGTPDGFADYMTSQNLAFVSIGLLWAFCVSTWVKSSALTVPATLLFLGLVAFPCWLMTGGSGWYRLSSWTLVGFLTLAAVGALFSARLGFVWGGEHGWSRGQATGLSVLSALLFFSPSWAWAEQRYLALSDTRLAIRWAYVGEAGHLAFVTLGRARVVGEEQSEAGPYSAVRVDLNTAEATLVGQLDGSAWSYEKFRPGRSSWFNQHGIPVFTLIDDLPLWGKSEGARSVYDGMTGERLAGDVRARGELAWQELHWPEEFVSMHKPSYFGHAGLGLRASGWGSDGEYEQLLWDPLAGLVVDLEELPGHRYGDRYEDVRIGPGRWLARIHGAGRVWVDPVNGEAEPAKFLELNDVIGPPFDDASLLIVRNGELMRIWPESGETRVWGVEGGLETRGLLGLRHHIGGSISSTERSAVLGTIRAGEWPAALKTRLMIVDPVVEQLILLGDEAVG